MPQYFVISPPALGGQGLQVFGLTLITAGQQQVVSEGRYSLVGEGEGGWDK